MHELTICVRSKKPKSRTQSETLPKSKFPASSTVVKTLRTSSSSLDRKLYEVIGPNGDKAVLSTLREDGLGNNNLLRVEIYSEDAAASIRVRITDTKRSISKIGNERRFKTLDNLDAAVAEVIQLLILVNPALPFDPTDLGAGTLVPNHPALKGKDLPPKLRPIVSVFLGAPYKRARAATERWMEQVKEKEQRLSDTKGIAKKIVDGTILGVIDTSTSERMKNKSRLALVGTADPKRKTRKRQLFALCGFVNERPCTDKQIARFERLSSPHALALVHDEFLRRHDRDKLEAAFHLSFKLEPGARNPILEADLKWEYSAEASEQRPKTQMLRYLSRFFSDIKEPEAPEDPDLNRGDQITLLPSRIDGWHLRLTDSIPAPDIRLWSVGLAPINLAGGNPKYMQTGMGFMALKFGDKEEFHLRPALLDNLPSYPEEHVNEFERAIDLAFSGSPARKKKYVHELNMQLARAQSRLA